MTASFTLHSRDYLGTPEGKKFYNEQLFTEVAPQYDRITRWMSMGRDMAWKRSMIHALPDQPPAACLDLACGTGDITRMLRQRFPDAPVTGLDLTPSMLDLAHSLTDDPGIDYCVGDMGTLPFPDASFDLVTGGYALRNAPDLPRAIAEIRRVLRPGGTCAFLDFSKPASPAGQDIGYTLLKTWGSLWGWLLHRNPDVYGYIAESLRTYPDRPTLRERFHASGLEVVASRRFYGGLLEWIQCRTI
jgi:demethylmenaquinone methyltransferase/2-methoxy-6-polyprenyl-1,4-benzoquinol methylase